MAFKIIRNDITKVMADAIVNTANPDPDYAAGVDAAIYAAAGTDALLHERRRTAAAATGTGRRLQGEGCGGPSGQQR